MCYTKLNLLGILSNDICTCILGLGPLVISLMALSLLYTCVDLMDSLSN